MALSGAINRDFAGYFRLRIEWTATQSQSNNTSTITSKLYLISLSSQATIQASASRRAWVGIEGTTNYSAYATNKVSVSGNQKKLMHTYTRTVGHNSAGNLVADFTGGIDWNLNINGHTGATVTISGTGTLNNIPPPTPDPPTIKPPKNVSITYPTTRVTFDNSIQLKWTSPADPQGQALQYQIAYRNSGSGYLYTSLFTNNNSTKTYTFDTTSWSDSTTAKFAIRSRNSSGLYSSWVYTPDLTVANAKPPLAATALTPNSQGDYPPELNTRFTWQINGGTGQTRYVLNYRKIGTSTWSSTGWVNTSRTYHDLPANTLTAGQYEWRIGHTGSNGLDAPWSALQQFEILAPTTAPSITKPTVSQIVNNNLIEVEWLSDPSQEAYELRLLEGTTVKFAETVNSALSAGYITYNIEHGATYTVQVRRKRLGVWSPYASRIIVAEVALPENVIIDPETLVTVDEDRGSISLSYTPPEQKINYLPSFTSGRWTGIYLAGSGYTSSWTTGYDAPTYIRLPAKPNTRYYGYVELGPNLTLKLTTFNSANTQQATVSAGPVQGDAMVNILTGPTVTSIEFRIEGGTNWDQPIAYPVLSEIEINGFYPGSDEGFTNVSEIQIHRRLYGQEEWTVIANNLSLTVGGYEDNTVGSGLLYEYKIVTIGSNGLMNSIEPFEAQVRFDHAFIHDATNPAIFFKLVLDDAREEELDVKGEIQFFAGRRLPIREYGVHETHQLDIEWTVDTPEELNDIKEQVKKRNALLYRDNAGRRFYATTNGVKAKDRQIIGHEMSMTLIETDFKEGVI